MTAYGNMSEGLPGLAAGFGGRIESACAIVGIDGGMPAFSYEGDEDTCYPFLQDTAKIVLDDDLAATNTVAVVVNGEAAAVVTYATSHAATMTAIVNAINALDGVVAKLDAADTNGRTILVFTKGVANVTTATLGGTTPPDAAVTTGSAQVFIGVVRFTQKELVDGKLYGAREMANIGAGETRTMASVTGAIVSNTVAYVDATTGAFAASGVEVGAKFRSNAAAISGGLGLAIVEVKRQTAMAFAGEF